MVADFGAVQTPSDGKICQEAAGTCKDVSRVSACSVISLTIFNEDAPMLRPSGRAHHDLDILDARCLACWPVDARRTRASRDTCQIQLQIPDLSEEHVCRLPALIAVTLVLVTVNQAKSIKARGCFDGRHRVWVADKLGKVVVDDGRGD